MICVLCQAAAGGWALKDLGPRLAALPFTMAGSVSMMLIAMCHCQRMCQVAWAQMLTRGVLV